MAALLTFVLSLVLVAVIEAQNREYYHNDEHLPVRLYYTENTHYQQPRRHRRHASASASSSSSGSGSSSFSSSNSGSFSGGGGGGGGFAFPQGFGPEEFQRQFNEFQNYMQHVANEQNCIARCSGAGPAGISNGLDSRFGGNSGGDSGFAFPSSQSFSSPGGTHGASATAHIGPQGGYGQADLHGGLGARFGAESAGGPFPATGGNNAPVGVFTSSSSGSSDINGKKSSFKEATSGVIGADGKVQGYSVRS